MHENLITITLPVTGKPDCPDWDAGRKVTVTPKTLTLYYRPGHLGALRAEITGPWRPSHPGIRYDRPGSMTVLYYATHPEHWPDWVRDLEKQYQPPA